MLAAPLLLALALTAAAERPNVVIILADDLGYGDVHAFNPDSTLATPHLDRLAEQGMRFVDAHTPSGVCTPTRYGLLTGRYCWRSRLKSGVLNGYGTPLIEPERPTLGHLMARAGYTTGVVGKWHLGLGFQKTDGQWDWSKPVTDSPHTHGFTHSHVIPASLDFPPYLYVRNGTIHELPSLQQPAQPFPAFLRKGPRAPELVMEDCLDDLLGEALGFIEREAKNDAPFFLYFPLTAPHKPVLPHSRFRGKTSLGPYGDFVRQVDWTVGRVTEALAEQGVADDTLILVTSDNGSFMYRRPDEKDHVADAKVQAYHPDHHTANGPWRGTKADIYEAGHRVAFVVRWPGKVEAGSRSEHTLCLVDVFATLSELTGTAVPDGAAGDSHSFLGALRGEAQRRAEPVIHHSASGMFSIREGRWKLILGNGSGGRENPRGKPFEQPWQLYDLDADPGETRNLADEHADVVQRLEQTFRAIHTAAR